MPISVEITSGPSVEPVTLADAKRWLRLPEDLTDQDDDVSLLIQAARETLEARLARCFLTQTVRETRTIPANGVLRLCRAPFQEVVSITVDGVALAEDAYHLLPNRVVLTSPGSLAVITYRCGYADDPDGLPATVKLVVRALVEFEYDNRLDPSEIPPYILSLANSLSWGGEGPAC